MRRNAAPSSRGDVEQLFYTGGRFDTAKTFTLFELGTLRQRSSNDCFLRLALREALRELERRAALPEISSVAESDTTTPDRAQPRIAFNQPGDL